MNTMTRATLAVAAVTALAGCASMMYTPPTADESMKVIRAGFAERGVAKLDRIEQTELQAACSQFPKGDLPKELRARLEKAAEASIKFPADGKWLGDWRQGERIAQSGVGLTFTDAPNVPAGGNCYACHQITKEEISFGNIGPTLYHYGKLRGNSEPIMRYTWARIWNSHAFNACSSMPRFGDAAILSEDQIRHLMALLFDPQSPANR
jgi:L-cysteine S-thiosulfotransferase